MKKAAFTFVSDSQFTHSRYALEICRSIEEICEEYIKPQVLKILRVILPALAETFQTQKGEIFGFGSYNENSHSLSTMNQDKQEGAPVHNLDAKQSVGSINYELSIRGSKQFSSASSTQVKRVAHDLIDNTVPGSYKEYSKVAKYVIPELCLNWAAKQGDLKKKGLVDKEIANVALDRRKTKDLEKLNAWVGRLQCQARLMST